MHILVNEWKSPPPPPPALSKLLRLNLIIGCVYTFVFLLKNPYRRNKKQPQKWWGHFFVSIVWFWKYLMRNASFSDLWHSLRHRSDLSRQVLFLERKSLAKSLYLLPLNVYSSRNAWDERDVMTVAHRIVDLKKTLNRSFKVWRLTCADMKDALNHAALLRRSEWIFGIGKQQAFFRKCDAVVCDLSLLWRIFEVIEYKWAAVDPCAFPVIKHIKSFFFLCGRSVSIYSEHPSKRSNWCDTCVLSRKWGHCLHAEL